MKVFHCDCGQRVFFDNTSCMTCGRIVGFDAASRTMLSLDEDGDRLKSGSGEYFRHCKNRIDYQVCNWLVPGDGEAELCVACRLNGTIPNLSSPRNQVLWKRLEKAKRRLLYGLISLELPFNSGKLTFNFLEDQRSNPWVAEPHVLIGHNAGQITINVAEADDVARESTRIEFQETYRTLLGHFRHEIGHFYWARIVDSQESVAMFRELFGDERLNYAQALARHHEQGPPEDWWTSYVSAYASAHPHEDWAETWAHYLHITDTLESAKENGLAPWHADSDWIGQWMELAVAMNELSRSMGVPDTYPFALTNSVRAKLEFIHQQVGAWRQTL